MKLAEIADRIPENVSFVVEEIDNNNNMTYGWMVDVGSRREADLALLKSGAYHEEVVSIRPETDRYRGAMLAIEVRYALKEES